MRKIDSVTKSNSTLHRIVLMGASSAVAQGAIALSTPIVSRFYAPSAYGPWALTLAAVSLLTIVTTLRYDLAIVLPKTNGPAASLFLSCLLFSLITASVVAVVQLFLPSGLAGKLGFESVWIWNLCVVGLVLCTGIFQTCSGWCVRRERFGTLGLGAVALSLTTIAFQIAGAKAGHPTATMLLVASALGQMTGALVLLLCTLIRDSDIIRQAKFSEISSVLFTYKKYPTYVVPYSLAGVLRERAILLLFTSSGSLIAMGYYAFSIRVVSILTVFLPSALRPVIFQKASVSSRQDLEQFLIKVLGLLLSITVPFWVVFLFNSKSVFHFAFGTKWIDANVFAVILSFPAFIQLMMNWTDRLFDILGKQEKAFQLETACSLFSVGGAAFGIFYLRSPLWGVLLQSMACVVVYCVWLYQLFQLAGFNLGGLYAVGRRFLFLFAVSTFSMAVILFLLPENLLLWTDLLVASAISGTALLTNRQRFVQEKFSEEGLFRRFRSNSGKASGPRITYTETSQQ